MDSIEQLLCSLRWIVSEKPFLLPFIVRGQLLLCFVLIQFDKHQK
jgi:hypothetical protein